MTNLQEFLSAEQEDAIQFARSRYMRAGPDFPIDELENAELGQAVRLLEPIQSVRAKELVGWISVEQMFQYPDHEERRMQSMARANAAFGWAYDHYVRADQQLRLGRLNIVAAFLPVYERLAAKEPIDDDLRSRTLGSLSVGTELLLGDQAPGSMMNEARLEAIVLMSRLGHRGDTRKPLADLALPATLRQRVAHLPRDIELKHGRYNWDVSLLNYRGQWQLKAGISIDSWQKRQEERPLNGDVLTVGTHDVLGVSSDDTTVRETLRGLIRYYAPYENSSTQETIAANTKTAPEATAVSKQLSRLIARHGVQDFGVGKDFI